MFSSFCNVVKSFLHQQRGSASTSSLAHLRNYRADYEGRSSHKLSRSFEVSVGVSGLCLNRDCRFLTVFLVRSGKRKLKQKFDLVCNTHCAANGNQPHRLSLTQNNSVWIVLQPPFPSVHHTDYPDTLLMHSCLCLYVSTNYKIISVQIHIYKLIGGDVF